MEKPTYKHVPDETVAAFLDGRSTPAETRQIIGRVAGDEELREVLEIAMAVDADTELAARSGDSLPVTAMAALSEGGNLCNLRCEMFILHRRGIRFDAGEVCRTARENGWLTDAGTALHNIGRLLEHHGLSVSRRYGCTPDDIRTALAAGSDVIAVVDGGELTDTTGAEIFEDIVVGEIPDHAVAVLDFSRTEVTVYNPDTGAERDTYPLSLFADAWADSRNYLVIVSKTQDNH